MLLSILLYLSNFQQLSLALSTYSSVSFFVYLFTPGGKCQLQIGTCQLPLQGLNHVLLQEAVLQYPLEEVQGGGQE